MLTYVFNVLWFLDIYLFFSEFILVLDFPATSSDVSRPKLTFQQSLGKKALLIGLLTSLA